MDCDIISWLMECSNLIASLAVEVARYAFLPKLIRRFDASIGFLTTEGKHVLLAENGSAKLRNFDSGVATIVDHLFAQGWVAADIGGRLAGWAQLRSLRQVIEFFCSSRSPGPLTSSPETSNFINRGTRFCSSSFMSFQTKTHSATPAIVSEPRR
jgi:hypothetical protein